MPAEQLDKVTRLREEGSQKEAGKAADGADSVAGDAAGLPRAPTAELADGEVAAATAAGGGAGAAAGGGATRPAAFGRLPPSAPAEGRSRQASNYKLNVLR